MILSCDALALLSDPVFDLLRTEAKELSNLHRRQAGLFPGGVVPNPSGRNVQYSGDVGWGNECGRATMRLGWGHQTRTPRLAFSCRSGSSHRLFSYIFLAQMMFLDSSNECCHSRIYWHRPHCRRPSDLRPVGPTVCALSSKIFMSRSCLPSSSTRTKYIRLPTRRCSDRRRARRVGRSD